MHVKFLSNARILIIAGILSGLLSFIMHRTLPTQWVETGYSRFLFKAIRTCFDYTVGFLPFPVIYIVLAAFLFATCKWILLFKRDRRNFKHRVAYFAFLLLGVLGWMFCLFYLFWGFNYDRITLEDQLGLEGIEITETHLEREFLEQTGRMASLRTGERKKIDSLIKGWSHNTAEKEIRKAAKQLMTELGYPAPGRVRCRELLPSGFLLRWGTAGFYNPFTGECNIDPGLHTLQKPYVLGHELFHGLGITGEGECNFLAYILCHRMEDPLIRYSGELGYWRYLAGSFRRRFPDQFREAMESLPQIVVQDIEDIDRAMDQYPNIAPKIRDAIYNAYLESNRIHLGMADYSTVVQMVIRWRNTRESIL